MNKDLFKIIISSILFIISFFIKDYEVIYFMALSLSYIIVAYELYINAFHNFLEKEFFDENILMILATIGAFIIGEYVEAIVVILLFQLGEYLSDRLSDKTKDSIINLMDLRSDTIRYVHENKIEVIATKDFKKGNIFEVLPGEIVALDGVVVEGESNLDTSSLTGESVPRKVTLGDTVLSGMKNLTGVLKIKAEKNYETSTASKIIDLMEHSNDKKTKTERWITKFSKIYTPVVVVIAILIAIIPLFLHISFEESIYQALVFLVMSCPCALVISVPLGFFQGIGRCSREGVLVKGSNELDMLTNIKTIIFDKTGTLTEGSFKVLEVYSNDNKTDILKISASCESFSNHPIAKSIINSYKEKIQNDKVSNYKEISGMGIEANYEGTTYYLGNELLMTRHKIMVPKKERTETIIHVATTDKYLGYIRIGDKIRNNAKETITKLRKMGFSNLLMLSGDNKKMVSYVAKQVGITEYDHSLLPQDKVEKVEKLSRENKTMFIGDGMNDAPVIKMASIGVSLGGIGSDIAIDASDIVLMKDDISRIPLAIKISKLTKKVVKWNILLAIMIKIIVLLLTIFGFSSIWMAITADVGVTLVSILNTFIISKKTKLI